MILRLSSCGRKCVASLIIIVLVFLSSWMVAEPWFAKRGLKRGPAKEGLLRAIKHDPQNPSYHYGMGLYYSNDPIAKKSSLALNRFVTAISLNPLNSTYWSELFSLYEGMGESAASELALKRAVALSPADLKTRWKMVNLKLRRGESDRAILLLKSLVADHPGQTVRVFNSLYSISGSDVGRVFKEELPGELELGRQYLRYLMRINDSRAVSSMWKMFDAKLGEDSKIRLGYIDYLLSRDEFSGAWQEWASYKGVDRDSGEVFWNGGFEDVLAGGGFGWRITRVAGVDTGLDNTVSHTGKSSLKVAFKGKSNISFKHISHIVALEPGATYSLSAYVKSDALTTDSGVYLEFSGIKGCGFLKQTEPVTGSNDWKEFVVEVTTPQGCGAGEVRVRRQRSRKLDNLISGRVWIDDVTLKRGSYARPF